MLPTISERRRHDAPYALDGDDDRRDWRYASRGPMFSAAYDDAPGQAPLPSLRSTLSYRDADGWSQRAPPAPSTLASVSQSHVRARLDLFAHLPLTSSNAPPHGSRVHRFGGNENSRMDVEEDDRYHSHHGATTDHAYHSQPYDHHHTVSRHGHEHDHDHGYGNGAPTTASTAAAKKRSRRMSNSERGKLYRSRRKEYVETLEDQVEALKQQLEEMKMKHSSGGSSDPAGRPSSTYDAITLAHDRTRAGLARIVCEYFSLFQFGVPVPSNGNRAVSDGHREIGSSPQQLQISQSPRLLSFIQTLVDPNMRFGNNFGVQMLLEQWQRYSAYHSALQYDLNSIEVGSHETTPVVSATATLRVRFSRTTIEKVFPHVLWNEALVQRLIGLEVEYPVNNKFYFGADNKIKRYETEVDFLSAFIEALGNSRDAMQLVGSALIKEQHRIGAENDEIEEGISTSAYGAGINRSPVGSASSSRSSVHSESHSPILSSAEASVPPRFKQSESRRSEEVVDELSAQMTASRVAREPRANQAYVESDAPPRSYSREASESEYGRQSYSNADRDHQYLHHDPRRSADQYHSPSDRDANTTVEQRRGVPGRYD